MSAVVLVVLYHVRLNVSRNLPLLVCGLLVDFVHSASELMRTTAPFNGTKLLLSTTPHRHGTRGTA